MQYASERPKPRLVQVMFSRALPADVVRRGRPGWVSMQRLEDAARSSHSIPAPRSAWSEVVPFVVEFEVAVPRLTPAFW
jgi:hypothetical protein